MDPGPGAVNLDADFARRQFPAPCWDVAYLENAGGSYAPQSVIDRVVSFMTETQVQPCWPFPSSIRAGARMEEGQRAMAALVNADPDEVTIGQSTRGNVYILAQAIRPLLKPGDEIVVTNLDHEANVGPWRRLAEGGIVVKEWRVDPETAELRVEGLEKLLTDRTRLVCFVHCSNITGAVHDAARIVKMAHDAGAWACVDGVAFAAHRPTDVKALDADFYLLSFYKLFGPHISMLYGKRERLEAVANQNFFFRGDIRRKLNPGDPSFELTPALTGIADYFDALYLHHFPQPRNDLRSRAEAVFGLIARHEEALAARFLDYARSEKRITLLGPATPDPACRAPTFSFRVAGRKSSEFPPALAARGVAIASGGFGVYRLMRALGLDYEDGVVRASMVHYNTPEEVDRLVAGLEAAI